MQALSGLLASIPREKLWQSGNQCTEGSLWQHGRKVESPDYEIETFHQVRIGKENLSFIKAGFAIDGHFLLPSSRHPWHRPLPQSYGVLTVLADGRRWVVPCVELIRFYFGLSLILLSRLFTTPLVSASTTDGEIWLRGRRSDKAPWFVAKALARERLGIVRNRRNIISSAL